jgi:hypothetical protein
MVWVSTKISLLTELSDGARLCPQDQSQRVDGRRRLKMFAACVCEHTAAGICHRHAPLLNEILRDVNRFEASLRIHRQLRLVTNNANVPVEPIFKLGCPKTFKPANKLFRRNEDD